MIVTIEVLFDIIGITNDNFSCLIQFLNNALILQMLKLACPLLVLGLVAHGHDFMIYKAIVSELSFGYNAVRKETVEMSFISACSRCLELSWCIVACRVTNSSYILSNLLVSGGGNDTRSGEKLSCFSRRRAPELLPSDVASVYGYSTIPRPNFHPSNLLNGVYDYFINRCYFGGTSSSWKPWVTFDLGRMSNVTKIVVRTQPFGTSSNKFHRVDIRLSSDPGTNPFYNEPLFAKHYTNPSRNQQIVLTPNSEIKGRYLTFKQNNGYQMQFCHLEVFGNYVYS